MLKDTNIITNSKHDGALDKFTAPWSFELMIDLM